MGSCSSTPAQDPPPVVPRTPRVSTPPVQYSKERTRDRNRKGYESNYIIRPLKSTVQRIEQLTTIPTTSLQPTLPTLSILQSSNDVDVVNRQYPHTTRHNRHHTADSVQIQHIHNTVHRTNSTVCDSPLDSTSIDTVNNNKPYTMRGRMSGNNVFNYNNRSHTTPTYNSMLYNQTPSIVVRSAELRPIVQSYNRYINTNSSDMPTHNMIAQRSMSVDSAPNSMTDELNEIHTAPLKDNDTTNTVHNNTSNHSTLTQHPIQHITTPLSNNTNMSVDEHLKSVTLHSKSTPDVTLLDKIVLHDATTHKPTIYDDASIIERKNMIRHRRTRSDFEHDLPQHDSVLLPASFHMSPSDCDSDTI